MSYEKNHQYNTDINNVYIYDISLSECNSSRNKAK